MNKLIYILIVNYNNYKDTIDCLMSLENINYDNYKIIIVDNSSTNNSINEIRKFINNFNNNNIILLKSRKNYGFAGGNNIGIKYALDHGADYILLLNDDTTVEPNFISNMLKTAEEDLSIGIVGCKIKYYQNKNLLWYTGGKINWFKFIGNNEGIKSFDNGNYNEKKEITFATGCCMLIKRQVFEKVGLLPVEYFMYFEDVDFCVKVQDAGYKIVYEPSAVIYHKVGISSGGEESPFAIKWMTRNRIYFMNKYKYKVSKFNFNISKLYFYSTRYIRILQFFLKGDKKRAHAIIEGIKEGKIIIKERGL